MRHYPARAGAMEADDAGQHDEKTAQRPDGEDQGE